MAEPGTQSEAPTLDLRLAKEVASRASLRAVAVAHQLSPNNPERRKFDAQNAALLTACAGTIDALVNELSKRS